MMWARHGRALGHEPHDNTDITGYTADELASRDAWLERAYGGRFSEIKEAVRR